jgi:hypothetical protein
VSEPACAGTPEQGLPTGVDLPITHGMACKAPEVWRKNTGKAMFSAIKPLIRHQVLSFVIPAFAGMTAIVQAIPNANQTPTNDLTYPLRRCNAQ